MKPRNLNSEEFPAIQAAAYLHGRKFKAAIRRAWRQGTYRTEGLQEQEGTLQRMRNSPDGHAVLESLRTVDFVANPRVAFLMGANRAKGEGTKGNPFGVASLAAAWREGFDSVKTA